jgi:serine O-acetyltransferase
LRPSGTLLYGGRFLTGGALVKLGEALHQDLLRYLNQSQQHQAAGDTLKSRISAILSPQMQTVVLYRLSHWFWSKGWRRAATAIATLNALVFKATISPAASIGPGLFLPHPPGITFCGSAGRGLTMYSMAVCCPSFEDGWSAQKGPRLGNAIQVGAHAVVQGPVQVGDRARIGFCVVLDRDAPPDVLVVSKAMRATLTPRGNR